MKDISISEMLGSSVQGWRYRAHWIDQPAWKTCLHGKHMYIGVIHIYIHVYTYSSAQSYEAGLQCSSLSGFHIDVAVCESTCFTIYIIYVKINNKK